MFILFPNIIQHGFIFWSYFILLIVCLSSGRVLVECLGEHHALYRSEGDPGGCSCL